jgi:hypothetical protein
VFEKVDTFWTYQDTEDEVMKNKASKWWRIDLDDSNGGDSVGGERENERRENDKEESPR